MKQKNCVAGQRVELKQDSCGYRVQVGQKGTIVATISGYPDICVQWDDWHGGHNGNHYQVPKPPFGCQRSYYYVRAEDIRKLKE